MSTDSTDSGRVGTGRRRRQSWRTYKITARGRGSCLNRGRPTRRKAAGQGELQVQRSGRHWRLWGAERGWEAAPGRSHLTVSVSGTPFCRERGNEKTRRGQWEATIKGPRTAWLLLVLVKLQDLLTFFIS